MKNFLILIREDIARLKEQDERESQAEIEAYSRWVEKLSETGNYLSGEPLEPAGLYMNPEQVVMEGPFIESKEVITGYILIKANSLEEAQSLASTCPVFEYGGGLELRPIFHYE